MPGSVTNNIKTNFLLSDDLARKYAAIVSWSEFTMFQ